jgi:uncharacterized protein
MIFKRNLYGNAGSRLLMPRRRWLALFFPVILISSSLFGLRWFEYALTFQPERYDPGKAWVIPKSGEEVTLLNRDHQLLDAWLVHSLSRTPIATIIFFHGQGGNISNVGWLGEKLSSLGFDVLLADYRGYGKSEGTISNEQDMYADADAAYDYVVEKVGIPANQVILYGHSLGTAAVVDLAARKACAGIILESGLSSAKDMASVRLPWLPSWLRAIGKNKFDSAQKLASVSCPVLVAHGDPDNVVPTDEGRKLYSAANQPKRLILVPGADHGVAGFGGDNYLRELTEFIHESLRGPSKTS